MNRMNRLLLALSFLLVSAPGFSQDNAITIRFIGNCGLHLTDGTTHVYSDFPYRSGAFNYMEFEDSQLDRVEANSVFLFTHKHGDHFSRKNMRQVLRAKGGKRYGAHNIKKLEQLATTIPDFEVRAFKTKHRFSVNHYSYLITWHGKRIFLSGDTESAATIGAVKNIDWAFIPYWLIVDAREQNIKIDTKMRGLYHLYPKQKLSGEIPADLVIFDEPEKVVRIGY